MKKLRAAILIMVFFIGSSQFVCAVEDKPKGSRGSYSVYSKNLFQGKQEMKRGEFQMAQAYFIKATESQRLTEGLAFAATASYKINDLKVAESYIEEAEKQDTGSVTKLRIAGYKALIYLKEGKENEGMKALQEYVALYSHLDPLMNIREVQAMAIKNDVDMGKLEALLDEQITWHEDEIEQYEKTGTGFYGRYD